MRLPASLRDQGGGTRGDRRVHRGLLQRAPSPLDPRLPQPHPREPDAELRAWIFEAEGVTLRGYFELRLALINGSTTVGWSHRYSRARDGKTLLELGPQLFDDEPEVSLAEAWLALFAEGDESVVRVVQAKPALGGIGGSELIIVMVGGSMMLAVVTGAILRPRRR